MTVHELEGGLPVTEKGSRPIPDPTELTDKAIAKEATNRSEAIMAEAALRQAGVDRLEDKIRGMEEATEIRSQIMNSFPQLIKDEVTHLELLQDAKLEQVSLALKDRDTLAQRESALNALALAAAFNASKEAVAAALTAQKEAAQKQDEANAKAIDKSERATAETIKTNQELAATRLDSLTKSLDELKGTVSTIVAIKQGNLEQRTETRSSNTALYALAGGVATLLGIALTVVTILNAVKP